jgi:hypothetical protein
MRLICHLSSVICNSDEPKASFALGIQPAALLRAAGREAAGQQTGYPATCLETAEAWPPADVNCLNSFIDNRGKIRPNLALPFPMTYKRAKGVRW